MLKSDLQEVYRYKRQNILKLCKIFVNLPVCKK